MRNIRVAFFTGPFPAISETFILRQISALRNHGYEVHVFPQEHGLFKAIHPEILDDSFASFVHYPPPIFKNPFLRILGSIIIILRHLFFLRTPWIRVLLPQLFGEYATNLRLLHWAVPLASTDTNFDVLISHFETPANRAAMLLKAGIIKGNLLCFFHTKVFLNNLRKDSSINRDIFFLKKYVFTNATCILAIHKSLAAALVSAGANPRKTSVFYMGCGNLLPPTDGAKSSGKTLIFLSVCRLIPKKGVDDALYALAKIKHQLPAWQYHIAGDGPQREVLEKLASTLRINNSVVFHGSVDQETISKFLLNADLFLAPSKTAPDGDCEGLPVAILEASSAGIPVISTYHEGIPEAVENNVSGFLVPENNIEALAASILLLGQNPAKRREMGLRGQEIIRSKFSQGLLDQKLIELVRAHSSTDRH